MAAVKPILLTTEQQRFELAKAAMASLLRRHSDVEILTGSDYTHASIRAKRAIVATSWEIADQMLAYLQNPPPKEEKEEE